MSNINEKLLSGSDEFKMNFQFNQLNLFLLKASENGHIEIVKELLKKNANIEEKDNSGYMPYELADMSGHFETKKYL